MESKIQELETKIQEQQTAITNLIIGFNKLVEIVKSMNGKEIEKPIKRARNKVTLEKYETSMSYKEVVDAGAISVAEVSKQTGIPASTIRKCWVMTSEEVSKLPRGEYKEKVISLEE